VFSWIAQRPGKRRLLQSADLDVSVVHAESKEAIGIGDNIQRQGDCAPAMLIRMGRVQVSRTGASNVYSS
jgi:hypothetical protein